MEDLFIIAVAITNLVQLNGVWGGSPVSDRKGGRCVRRNGMFWRRTTIGGSELALTYPSFLVRWFGEG